MVHEEKESVKTQICVTTLDMLLKFSKFSCCHVPSAHALLRFGAYLRRSTDLYLAACMQIVLIFF